MVEAKVGSFYISFIYKYNKISPFTPLYIIVPWNNVFVAVHFREAKEQVYRNTIGLWKSAAVIFYPPSFYNSFSYVCNVVFTGVWRQGHGFWCL